MLTVLGNPSPTDHGVSRRRLLQAGGTGLLGLSLPRVIAAEQSGQVIRPRAKSVIFLFLFGGPSQLETFDLKPDAPAKIRGPYQPIACRTPGLRISERLPGCAAVSDQFAVIRTVGHDFNDHSGGAHYLQTGRRWQVPIGGGFNVTPQDWPSMGSVAKFHAPRESSPTGLPPYVVVPNFLGRLQEYNVQLRRPGETAGWLGRGFDPLTTRIDKRDAKDNPYFRDCVDEELTYDIDGLEQRPGLTLDRLRGRGSLLDQFNDQRRLAEERGAPASFDAFRQQAFELVSSERTRQAFNLRSEPADLRERYGRNLFGQSTLVARRLVEAGVRFVTVHYDCCDGYSWDSHIHSDDVHKHLLPSLDRALSTLVSDLGQRGLLDETLVVCLGEMGRTPQASEKWGRNHWSYLFPAVLAGAGVRGGALLGESDKDAAYPLSQRVTPEDLAATIYYALGIDPGGTLLDPIGRRLSLVDGGRPLTELFA